MASRGQWAVIFDDKLILKKYAEGASEGVGYKVLDNDAFWNDPKFSNIWAIQYGNSVTSDEVEYRDETPHSSYADANLGDFQTQFIDKWDALHLSQLQSNWDIDTLYNEDGTPAAETEEEKIARLGPRPTSYSS